LPKIKTHENLIKKIAGSAIYNELLSRHTTLQVGGPADLFISPQNIADLKTIVNYSRSKKIPLYVIGWGCNLLVCDNGFPGIVINLQTNMNHFSIQGENVIAEGGTPLPLLIQEALETNLTGMDFLYGIPGTIGGCTCMNAGTNHHAIGELIQAVRILDIETIEERILTPDEIGFAYRKSNFLEKADIILEVTLSLHYGRKQEELQKLRLLKEKRRNSQPLQYPNAGCIWKNPENGYAGKIIEEVGLKGFQIGGAKISDLHANFIINTGKATADDMMNLILHTEKIVREKLGIDLKREIQVIGKFSK
jgi:UDP-N-acetylmuramate dehydrogenase